MMTEDEIEDLNLRIISEMGTLISEVIHRGRRDRFGTFKATDNIGNSDAGYIMELLNKLANDTNG